MKISTHKFKKLADLIKESTKREINEESASEEAKKKGLKHLGYGIYGKENKPMFRSENGRLIAIKRDESPTKHEKKPGVNIFDKSSSTKKK